MENLCVHHVHQLSPPVVVNIIMRVSTVDVLLLLPLVCRTIHAAFVHEDIKELVLLPGFDSGTSPAAVAQSCVRLVPPIGHVAIPEQFGNTMQFKDGLLLGAGQLLRVCRFAAANAQNFGPSKVFREPAPPCPFCAPRARGAWETARGVMQCRTCRLCIAQWRGRDSLLPGDVIVFSQRGRYGWEDCSEVDRLQPLRVQRIASRRPALMKPGRKIQQYGAATQIACMPVFPGLELGDCVYRLWTSAEPQVHVARMKVTTLAVLAVDSDGYLTLFDEQTGETREDIVVLPHPDWTAESMLGSDEAAHGLTVGDTDPAISAIELALEQEYVQATILEVTETALLEGSPDVSDSRTAEQGIGLDAKEIEPMVRLLAVHREDDASWHELVACIGLGKWTDTSLEEKLQKPSPADWSVDAFFSP